MPRVAFDFRFTVRLPAPARAAYRWATDYAPDDPARMGQDGHRRIAWVADRTALLTDRIVQDGKPVTKVRLVRLSTDGRSWTNTHLAGPNRHSQFWYRIVPRGPNASALQFVGLQVEPSRRALTPRELVKRARAVRREDVATWRRLARVMARELGRSRPAGRSRRRR
ncbi:MAG TPA: hypothetical protein VMH49_06895 [Thermoplasmata archaeon]|nr:hypothetical protein [Thermoplasmata archaeon]